jgi:formylglycine-generating enzyme required for sulfatase activity
MRLHFLAACAALAAVSLPLACSSASGDDTSGAASDITPNPNGKNDGATCHVGNDCKSGLCTGGSCTPTQATQGNPNDGKQDGQETDVDCGGSGAPKCADGKKCGVGDDCQSASCKSGVCAAPAPDDGVKNGDETDVDCGGTKAPKCAEGKVCGTHDDCSSSACSYENKCVAFKGCTAHAGGDTCGAGETGEAGATHESCCTQISITDKPSGAFSIDKYQVTAGRMRAFVERYNGDLQTWAQSEPKWNQAWTQNLPANMNDALYLLGPGGKRGCNVVNQGGRTYWQGPIDGNAQEQSDFTKDVLDEKSLNCVTWYLAQAVCTFDGGRLASNAELSWLFQNGSKNTQYPWNWNDTASYNPNGADIRLVHNYSYQTPNPPAAMRIVGSGASAYPLDHAFWIAPPGRRPGGADQYGAMDVAGNMLMWINDGAKSFAWTMSWEAHPRNAMSSVWQAQDGPDGYYAIGARCAH